MTAQDKFVTGEDNNK